MNERLYAVYRREGDESAEGARGIRVYDESVEVRYGNAGKATGYQEISRQECLNKDPWAEMRWRRSQWIMSGFVRVGYGDYPRGQLRMLQAAETAVPQQQPKDPALALHWAANRHFAPAALDDLLLDIARALRDTGHVVGARSLYVDGWCGLSVETPNRLWTIRRQGDGMLAEAGQDGASRLLEGDGVVPFLVLMRIEREFPGAIEFVWLEQSDAWRVQPKLARSDPYLGDPVGPYVDTLRVAEALGLCPTITLLANEVENDHPIVF